MGIGNSNLNRGKANERASCEYLNEIFGPHWKWRRKLGAGRREDEGDLENVVDRDVLVQAKVTNKKNFTSAVRKAVDGASKQAGHIEARFPMGLTKVPGARSEPRWLVSTHIWPTALPDSTPVIRGTEEAMRHLRHHDEPVIVIWHGVPDMVLSSVSCYYRSYVSAVPGTL